MSAQMIAMSLSPAMRKCVLWLKSTTEYQHTPRSERGAPTSQALNAAVRAGLVRKEAEDFAWLYWLTPLGAEVRAWCLPPISREDA